MRRRDKPPLERAFPLLLALLTTVLLAAAFYFWQLARRLF